MTVALDTLTVARRMEAAGMDREQAEAVAATFGEAVEVGRAEAATKADLGELKAELRADMAELRTELKADMTELETRLTWRILGFFVAANALLVAAIELIP